MKPRTTTAAGAPAQWRRAFGFGVANGILFNFGAAFTDPATILPAFVSRLTASGVAVGAVMVIAGGLNRLPQLVVANLMQTHRRKLHFYRAASVVRVVCWPAIAAITYLYAAQSPGLALAGFFVFYGVFTVASGVSSITFLDVISRTLPANRLGRFFALRQIVGGVLAFLAGFAVSGLLRDGGQAASVRDYAQVFAWGSVPIALALLAFSLMPEREGEAHEVRTPLATFLLRAPGLLKRDANFRRFFWVQILVGASAIAVPFYTLYCRRGLAIPETMIGTYVSATVLGRVASNLVWGPLNDRSGSLALLRLATALNLLAPSLALALGLSPLPPSAEMWWFAAVFFFMGAATAGGFIGATNYLMEASPELDRPLYLGVLNTFGGVVALFPIVGGIITDYAGFEALFAVAAATAAAAALFTRRLAAPRREDAAS